jgi:hypothetical protein
MAEPTTAPTKPLVVGVTGHRNPHPEMLASLHTHVEHVFERLEREVGPPIVVLSSLAEGADRLVAEIALRRGHALVAPLPLPVREYEKDFGEAASRAQFHALLARAERHCVVDSPPGEDATGKPGRDAAYRRAGALVAERCHLLLALWDGTDSGKTGGTWDIVRLKRAAGGIVVRIHTSRATERRPAAVATHWPDGWAEARRGLVSLRPAPPAGP